MASSGWIKKDLFARFVDEKRNEAVDNPSGSNASKKLGIIWGGKMEKGTPDKPKIYEGRFLPDPNDEFYKKILYHMFQNGESWNFSICDKTFGFENWCPWCYVTQQLYAGSAGDKKLAYKYKRKEKFVGNFFIVKDPRDEEIEDAEKKSAGKVKLYEFPSKVESKLKDAITDSENGLGPDIFDPEQGYNFILKVKSTKPDPDGKVWPDYSDSQFARKATALGKPAEIKAIMDQRHSIMEYLTSQKVAPEDTEKVLKSQMLWDLVEAEFTRMTGRVPDVKVKSIPKEEVVNETKKSNIDDDLLKELDDL